MTLAECCDDVERRSQYNALTEPIQRPTRAACPGIEKTGFNARFHGERARRTSRKSRRPGRAKKQQAQRRPSAANTAPRGAASAPREANGAWLSLESNLNRSARQAFDSTVTLLSRGGGDDDGYDDEVHIPERRRRESASHHSRRSVWLRDSTGGPFDHIVLLQEAFEVDHIAPLHRGGSFENDIYSLQAPHKRCHLPKNNLEQRRS